MWQTGGLDREDGISSFNGNQESWVEFRRVFKELMKTTKQGAVLELAQLASKLPAEA